MKVLSAGVAVASIVIGSAALAKNPPNSPAQKDISQLNRALSAVAATTQAAGPPAKTVDNDQGDDHANPGAILKVCSKDTPAARRAAICPVAVSPE